MQDNTDIVRLYFKAIDQGDLKQAGQLLADSFERFDATASRIMGKHETLDVLRRLQEAIPNYKHALSKISGEDDVVRLTVQTGGRHTQPLDLAYLGIGIREGIVPGSGRVVTFEPCELEYTVIDGKIMAEHNVTPAKVSQGIPGFLEAIGFSG